MSRHIVPGRDADHLPIEQQFTHWDAEKDTAKPRASCKRFDIPDELMTERATRLWLKGMGEQMQEQPATPEVNS